MTSKDNNALITKDGIINVILENIVPIKKFGVKKIGLFGSIMNEGTISPGDIDILVEFEDNLGTFENLMDLYLFLKDILGEENKIDLVTKGSLSPYIGPYILKEVSYIEATS